MAALLLQMLRREAQIQLRLQSRRLLRHASCSFPTDSFRSAGDRVSEPRESQSCAFSAARDVLPWVAGPMLPGRQQLPWSPCVENGLR
eukprot:10123139-Alexandrium_andersonii.AAC.1